MMPTSPYLNKDIPQKDETEDSVSGSNVLESFAKDTGPAAEAVARLLQDPTPERAAVLVEDLPSLLPEDPALASVIAEEMAKQFCKTKVEGEDDDGEITQEMAEKIYEEMMSK